VRHAVNLGIDNDQPVPLAAMLWSRLGLPVALDNDLNVAALGAAHLMPAFGGHSNDLAFLSLGTGLAAGIVLGGIIRRGGGAAGEIGHIPVAPGGIACPCGQRGCLEQYASGAALDRMWPGPGDVPPPQDLFAQAASGNPKAIAVRDRYADAVALAVQMIALTIDVRWIVIGGGVASVGDPLLDAVRRALTRVADRSPFLASLDLEARVQLAPATLPIAAVGASLLALARW
jgi:predicted NBD/HSP70 family sugar kinase